MRVTRGLVEKTTIETLLKYAIMDVRNEKQEKRCSDLLFLLLDYGYDYYDLIRYFASLPSLSKGEIEHIAGDAPSPEITISLKEKEMISLFPRWISSLYGGISRKEAVQDMIHRITANQTEMILYGPSIDLITAVPRSANFVLLNIEDKISLIFDVGKRRTVLVKERE